MNSRRAQNQAHLNELKSRIDAQRQKLATRSIAAIATVDEQAFKQAEKKHPELRSRRKNPGREPPFQPGGEARLAALRQKLSELETERRRQRQDERNAKQGEQTRLQAQLDVLDQAEKSLSGYADGARYLLDAALKLRLKGASALSSGLDVPAEYETAIAAALGDAFDVVVVGTGQGVDQALDLLEKATGRAVILPLDAAKSTVALKLPQDGAVLGLASELIKTKAELRPAVDLLLGGTVLVRDRAAARRLRAVLPTARLVTLKGEVFRANGLVHAGKEARAVALSRPREKRELTERLTNVVADFNSLTETLAGLTAETTGLQKEISVRETSVQELRRRFNETGSAEQQAALAYESARRQRDWQAGQKDALAREVAASERDQTETELALDDVEGKLGQAQEAMRKLNGEVAGLGLDELTSQVSYWGARVSVSQRTVNDAQARQHDRQQALPAYPGPDPERRRPARQ
jgi:chromosome segregation protein